MVVDAIVMEQKDKVTTVNENMGAGQDLEANALEVARLSCNLQDRESCAVPIRPYSSPLYMLLFITFKLIPWEGALLEAPSWWDDGTAVTQWSNHIHSPREDHLKRRGSYCNHQALLFGLLMLSNDGCLILELKSPHW